MNKKRAKEVQIRESVDSLIWGVYLYEASTTLGAAMANNQDDFSLLDAMLENEGDQKVEVELGEPAKEGEARPDQKIEIPDEVEQKPVILPTVAGMKPGTRFEMRSGRPEVDGIWTVVQVEASEASASKRFVYASRAPDAAPPYAMLTEFALIDALHTNQITIIEHGDVPEMGGVRRMEGELPPPIDEEPKSSDWLEVIRALRSIPLGNVYRDEASFRNDVQRRLSREIKGAKIHGNGDLTGREVPVLGGSLPDLVIDLKDGDSIAVQLRLHRDGDALVLLRDSIGKAFLHRARYRFCFIFLYSVAYAHPPKMTFNDDRYAEAILEPNGVYMILRDPGFRSEQ